MTEYMNGFSAGAKAERYGTIALLEDYKDKLYEDTHSDTPEDDPASQIARAEAVEYCLNMLGVRN
jgi:hypothetical protein